jgi:hypothetical protein
MKYLMILGLTFLFVTLGKGQAIPVKKEVKNCYRIDAKTVTCDLVGLDQNLNLADDKVLDSLFKSGQANDLIDKDVEEYHGEVVPDGNSAGDIKESNVYAKRVIITQEDKDKSGS